MRTKTRVQAGRGVNLNHNQTLLSGLKLKTTVKAGQLAANHNQIVAGLSVKTSLKAGYQPPDPCFR